MKALTSLIFFPILLFSLLSFTAITQAATLDIVNRCGYPVWEAAVPGGGRRLETNQAWRINVAAGTTRAHIWGRTNGNFDGNGRGRCQTAEYALNQWNNIDFFDISLVDGFNVPMDFSPTGGCRGIRCTADIYGQCPNELRVPGGCNNPCTTFRTDEFCCNSGNCGPTYFSRFFKDRCQDAYSYPKDDSTSTFICPGGTSYRVVFCPR
ncbi:hypothetical protein MKX01_017747 [Papaver californicum]|nr:hypothetical protein MKX01_017747 [Papaver californicum]